MGAGKGEGEGAGKGQGQGVRLPTTVSVDPELMAEAVRRVVDEGSPAWSAAEELGLRPRTVQYHAAKERKRRAAEAEAAAREGPLPDAPTGSWAERAEAEADEALRAAAEARRRDDSMAARRYSMMAATLREGADEARAREREAPPMGVAEPALVVGREVAALVVSSLTGLDPDRATDLVGAALVVARRADGPLRDPAYAELTAAYRADLWRVAAVHVAADRELAATTLGRIRRAHPDLLIGAHVAGVAREPPERDPRPAVAALPAGGDEAATDEGDDHGGAAAGAQGDDTADAAAAQGEAQGDGTDWSAVRARVDRILGRYREAEPERDGEPEGGPTVHVPKGPTEVPRTPADALGQLRREGFRPRP